MEAFNASKTNNESNGDSNNEGLSFEEIGRMIGQRWRAIQEDELVKYKELAKRDSERYREQMKTFYKDELTLMCKEQTAAAAAAVASNNTGDSKMPASQFSNTPSSSLSGSSPITAFAASSLNVDFSQASQQTMMNSSGQRQDQLLNNMLALSSVNNNPTHNSNTTSNMYSNSIENNQATNNNNQHLSDMDTSMDDQVLQLLIQHQQQQTPTMSQASSEAILKLALSRKVSMQQRQQKLSDELRVLQLKMSLLDTMLAKEAMSNMSSHRQYQAQQQQGSSGMSTNIDSRLLSVLTGTNNSVGDINSQQGAPSMNMNGTQQDFRSMFGNNNISQQQQQDTSGRLQQIMNNQQGQQGIMNNQQGQQGSPPLMNNDNNNDNGSSMQISAEQMLFMQKFMDGRGNNNSSSR